MSRADRTGEFGVWDNLLGCFQATGLKEQEAIQTADEWNKKREKEAQEYK